MELDEALSRLGDWGRWQVLYFTMLSTACMFPASWHMFAIVFIGETFNIETYPSVITKNMWPHYASCAAVRPSVCLPVCLSRTDFSLKDKNA